MTFKPRRKDDKEPPNDDWGERQKNRTWDCVVIKRLKGSGRHCALCTRERDGNNRNQMSPC